MAAYFIKWKDFDANGNVFRKILEIVEMLGIVLSQWQPKHGFPEACSFNEACQSSLKIVRFLLNT